MNTHAEKTPANQKQAAANSPSQGSEGSQLSPLMDNRPETVIHQRMKNLSANSWQTKQLATLKDKLTSSSYVQENVRPGDHPEVIQKKENNTGLPDNLKSGIETLSGVDISDVKVHYNSDKPSQLQAHAYAQGTEIHVAPGQERHLPHEAWHVVQQKQGRVKPTLQLKSGTYVNDDVGLEKEADVMGEKAGAWQNSVEATSAQLKKSDHVNLVHQRVLSKDKLNVAGEDHDESGARRDGEIAFCKEKAGGNYWTENEFPASDEKEALSADSPILLLNFELAAIKEKIEKCDFKAGAKTTKIFASIIESLKETEELEQRFLEKDAAFAEKYNQYDDVLGSLFEAIFDNKYEEAKKQSDAFLKLGSIDTVAEASKKRGIAMHKAAQAQFQKKGVWKIGDAHVDQIKDHTNETKEDVKYNLMSQQEFNTEIAKWVPPPPPLD